MENIEIVSFYFDNKKLADIACDIRKKVFVEEQKVDEREEYDDYENESTHYLASINNFYVGTARHRFTDKGIKLERFAVLPDFRNKGAGMELVKFVLQNVIDKSDYIYLHAQLSALKLYSKFNFKIEGDIFYEANIAHYKMVYYK